MSLHLLAPPKPPVVTVVAAPPCHSDGPRHDCAYVEARNRLIPEAEELATQAHPHGALETDPGDQKSLWAQRFHAEMMRLAKETGLTG